MCREVASIVAKIKIVGTFKHIYWKLVLSGLNGVFSSLWSTTDKALTKG